MFNKVIRRDSLPFISDAADRAFYRIDGDPFRDDYSMVATLRALLLKRLEDNGKLRVRTATMRYSRRDYERNSVSDIINAAFGERRGDYPQTLYIASIESPSDAMQAFMTKVSSDDNGLKSVLLDVQELVDIEAYLKTKVNAKFFFSKGIGSAFVFVEKMNLRTYHLIQVFCSHYLPWFFDEKPLDDSEKKLLVSLSKTNPEAYIEIMTDKAAEYDVRSYAIREIIGNFERRSQEARVRSVTNEVHDLEQRVDENVRAYQKIIERLDMARVTLAGFKSLMESGKSEYELMNLFLRQKNLEVLSADDSKLYFVIRTHLNNFDPDMYERYRDNEESFIWYHRAAGTVFEDRDNRRKFMDAIFSSEPVLKINMCAYMRIDLRGSVGTESRFCFSSAYDDCIPNPHLNRHSCFGNHKPVIEGLLRSGDVIGAVMQCIASAGSVNVAEDVSFGPMLDELFTTTKKVIELPDGAHVSPVEAWDWLNNFGNTEEIATEMEGEEVHG